MALSNPFHRLWGKQEREVNDRHLVAYYNPDSMISEQIRNIRTNIKFVTKNQKNQTILVTSAESREGKSTVIANLAVSLVQNKEKVLLIDANLRNPIQDQLFSVSNKSGLSQVLAGRLQLEETIFQTGIGLLDILPGGPASFNPSELLSSERMQEIIGAVRHYYDLILVDAPSVEVTDAKILAHLCDGVILVLDRGKTSTEKAIEAKKVIEFAGSKVIGAVFNEK